MPALKNHRHEAMATNLAAGKPQFEAYKLAGYAGGTRASANVVAQRPEVKSRVQEIIATQHRKEIRSNELAIEKASVDKGYVVERLKFAAELGLRGRPILDAAGAVSGYILRPNLNAAVKALDTLADMGGFRVQRVEIGGPGDFARMTDAELNRELILVGESIGLSGPALQKALAYEPEETE